MLTSKELLKEYIDALGTLDDTRDTCPTGKHVKRTDLKQWDSAMRTVRGCAKRHLVDYIVALLHEDTASRGELDMFDVDARLSSCLDPEPLAKLIEEARGLGLGGYRWIEEAVTRQMANVCSLPLRAQAVNIGGVIDLVVVPRVSSREENVDRIVKQRARV